MKIVSDLLYTQIGKNTEILRAIRFRDSNTGEEYLADPHEVINPNSAEVGDENAFKVSLFAANPEESLLAATYGALQR